MDDIKFRFQALSKKWRRETAHLSRSDQMAAHLAYREIISMGMPVVPYILADLSLRANMWFIALEEITGKNPVPENADGDVKLMASSWLAWGKEEGFESDLSC